MAGRALVLTLFTFLVTSVCSTSVYPVSCYSKHSCDAFVRKVVLKRGFFKSRLPFFNNYMATFNWVQLQLVSIHLNSGPSEHNTEDTACGLKTLYMNSRGLKALVDDSSVQGSKISKLILFQNLVYANQFDIVCVCETWLNEDVLDNEILQGYTIYRNDRSNYRGGGVLLAIKSDLRSLRRNQLEGTHCELVMVEVFPLGRPKLIIGVFYRPPNDNTDSLLDLRSSLDILDESCRFILVGDFNLPRINWSHDYPTPSSCHNLNK